ncbi:MAG: TetR/AcrR family transcriptional regulator [Lachnospiraceae bacterium]|nr:TetR/AcrR family transcriptional regulator [Lachnospiraceae bacterium]
MSRNKYPEETVKLILEKALKLFIEKGYDNTSIQDIINNLGGLSKGAIYHHFKSKEDIFEAVCQKLGEENAVYYDNMRDDKTKNGYEKLKEMIRSAYTNPNNDAVIAMQDKIAADPKFLMSQIRESYELVAPKYIEPIIRQGIADGSIKTDYPRELASVIITLLNIWINPMIEQTTAIQMRQKLKFFGELLCGIGIDLIDDEITEQYAIYCEQYNRYKKDDCS